MDLRQLQQTMDDTFGDRDRDRGVEGTFMWFVEEVGELAAALRSGSPEQLEGEFADCLAWLVSTANVAGADIDKAIGKFAEGCPYCQSVPCECPRKAKP